MILRLAWKKEIPVTFGHITEVILQSLSTINCGKMSTAIENNILDCNLAICNDNGQSETVFSLFTCWVILHALLVFADFYKNVTFLRKPFRNTISVSNSLDLDQARHVVGSAEAQW